MKIRLLTVCGALTLAATSLFADFTYRETTQVTGGAMAGMMKMVSKQMRGAIESQVAIKGNRMARRSDTRVTVIDLDARTITEADLEKKTYSVMTFDEMKQAMENLSKKMKQDTDVKFKVSAEPTGKTKNIAGFDAKEVVLRMAMEATDAKSKQSGAITVVSDLWVAENVPGYAEMSAFHKKMAEELNWNPGNSMFMSQPQMAKGMTEAYKAVAEMKGAPVLQIVAMGPEGMAVPSPDAPPAQSAAPKISAGSALAGALGGRLGGFGRKKAEPAPEAQQPQGGAAPAAASLVEMRMEYSGFASTADASLFDIPAGFKQVDSEMKKMK